ncbi:MAG TPA: hypothetical protein VLV78_07935 [Thermoanaerobaculia bacterium]|nr:hypothetical protein [Thermoanaerobaculia bacterium]
MAGLTWRGAWSVVASYAKGDAISSNGSSWIANAANAGEAPGTGTHWDLLADRANFTGAAAGGVLAGTYPNPSLALGAAVRSLNGLTDLVTLAASGTASVSAAGNTLTIIGSGIGNVSAGAGIGVTTSGSTATVSAQFGGSGAATTVSHSDHQHSGGDITSGIVSQTFIDPLIARDAEVMPIVLANTATPVSIGAVNFAGTATAVARADHVHAHGNLGGGTLHATATTTTGGFMSSADKTKLDAIGSVFVSAANSVDTNVICSTVPFGSPTIDTASAYNATTSTFTAPTAGMYMVGVNLTVSAGPGFNAMTFQSVVNGISDFGYRVTPPQTGSDEAVSWTRLIHMSAGDTLSFVGCALGVAFPNPITLRGGSSINIHLLSP